jgi:hypothetical protein
MKQLSITFLVIFSLQFISAQVFEVDTLQYNGDSNSHINLVILGDGYQEQELPLFVTDATTFTNALFNERPYEQYQNYFNVFLVKVPSNESGASHPGTATDVNEPDHPVSVVDNYFGSAFDSYNIHRLLVPTNPFAIYNVLAANAPDYDQAIILVNSPYYGGSGGEFATSSTHTSANEIAIHEIGHSFVELIDEYYAGDVYANEGINMTQETNPANVKWKNWSDDFGIGIYQHCCGQSSASWYKPHENCKMQYLGSSFCNVCVEGTIERIHSLVSPISSYSPANSMVEMPTFPLKFKLDLTKPMPNSLESQWVLNGSGFDMNIDSISILENDLNIGNNQLVVFVEDKSDFLRVNNHSNIHLNSITWTINNTPVGIEVIGQNNEIHIELFPNPTSGIVQVKFKIEAIANRRIDLLSIDGKQLKTIHTTAENAEFDLSNLESGTYLLSFYLGDVFIGSRKVIKK